MATVKNFSSVELHDKKKRALCLGQGFVVSKPFHLGNFLEDWNKFKNNILRRMFFFCNDSSNSAIHLYRRSTGRHAPVGSDYDSKVVENFLLSCEKQFLSKHFISTACKIRDNIISSERQGFKELISNPNVTVLMQDASKQLAVIDTKEYESKMESILQDRSQHCQVEIYPPQEFKCNVIDWANQYVSKGDIDDVTYEFITCIDTKRGNVYGLIKCHKEGRPPSIIAPGCNTAVENLSHWVRDQIKPLADTCKHRLQDTNDIIFWINKLNEKYAPFSQNMVLVSFDDLSMYPNISLEHGLKAIHRKL